MSVGGEAIHNIHEQKINTKKTEQRILHFAVHLEILIVLSMMLNLRLLF